MYSSRLSKIHGLVCVFFLLVFSAPTFAATDYYRCSNETGTVFSENLEFGYDNLRNTIVLLKHQNGSYTPNFTLGNVRKTSDQLEFVFEYWEQGAVAKRNSHKIELDSGYISLKQDLYSDDGAHLETGQTALGACSALKVADESVTNLKPTIPSDKKPSPAIPQGVTDAALNCHTEQSSLNIAKSVTWCVLSTLAEQPDDSFGPDHFIKDGAWCEGDEGYGIGALIEVSFEPYDEGGSPPFFDRLLISNGYDQTTQTFMENSRVKQIEIKTDDGQTLVRTLRDETGVQEVSLGDLINPRGILITILDVYPGQKYDDTCLSYVMADFSF